MTKTIRGLFSFGSSSKPSDEEVKSKKDVASPTTSQSSAMVNNNAQVQSSHTGNYMKTSSEIIPNVSSSQVESQKPGMKNKDLKLQVKKRNPVMSSKPPVSQTETMAPTASPEIMTPDEIDALDETITTNSNVMKSIQQRKQWDFGDGIGSMVDSGERNDGMALLNVTSPGSSNALDDFASSDDTGSMASMNMLDDDQIERMQGYERMEEFANQLDETDLSQWKQMTLPAKINFLEDYVKFKPLVKDKAAVSVEGKISVHSADGRLVSADAEGMGNVKNDKKGHGDTGNCYPDVQEVRGGNSNKSGVPSVIETTGEITESTHL